MAIELPKNYDSKETEDRIYKLWEKSGFFNPDKLPERHKNPFVVIMPPPNANAPLHVGHALGTTIQDILIRYNRMRGKKTLYLPGTDHAGFETQVVFEKFLEKQDKSRFKMTREEFYKECWDFVQKNKHLSEEGLKKLGASCDWDRNIFTLDPEIVNIVYETFEKMYREGLVYRSGRICNWCPKHQTGLADLETKYEEREDVFYYFQYGPFTIGTARPETKFGDKYVVVHPDDKRYSQYKNGQKIELEWINGPITATVIKDPVVDMEFGSGAMTITPWHDQTDFDIAKRHKLDFEQIIDFKGKLLPIAGEFAGMKIEDARPKIVEKLKSKGLLVKEDKNYKHNIQTCYKCGRIIEPQVVLQWYIATDKKENSLKEIAIKAVESGEVQFVSKRFENLFMSWMRDLRDWPISRQIWWGIPIPVKYCDSCQETFIDTKDEIKKCKKCDKPTRIDPDTFDTWFSSGQWPFATLLANDAKRETDDFKNYFPTDVMETGWDIIFFWVARMIMLSYYRTGKPPFKKVLLHGLVRDKDRQKMSKSKGNVVDPLGVIDEYGTDALRMALVFSTSAGNDIPLAEDKIKGMKHFANKIWNIARFVIMTLSEENNISPENPSQKTEADKKIMDLMEAVEKSVTQNMEKLFIHEAAQEVYHFIWHEFADKYIEESKKQLADPEVKNNTTAILANLLVRSLKLLHPFMPFVTEEIYSKLPIKNKKLLIVEEWPVV